MAFVPWALAQYAIDAPFSTSVGLIHHELDEGVMMLNAQTGAFPPETIADYLWQCTQHIPEYTLTIEDDAQSRFGSHVYLPALSPGEIQVRMQESIIRAHTRVVEYWGGNSQLYTKTCTPSRPHVSLNDELLIRTSMIPAVATFGGQEFSFSFACAADATDVPVLLETDLPEKIPLCQQCGLLDDRDRACPVCGKFVCWRCLPANTGICCSDECRDKKHYVDQQESLLKEIYNSVLREQVRGSQEQVIKVYSSPQGEVVFTTQAIHLCLDLSSRYPFIRLARSDVNSIDVRSKGIWPARRWEVNIMSRQYHIHMGNYNDRVDAEALADVVNRWISGQL